MGIAVTLIVLMAVTATLSMVSVLQVSESPQRAHAKLSSGLWKFGISKVSGRFWSGGFIGWATSALGHSRRFWHVGVMSGAVEGIGLDVIQAPKREPRIMRYELTDFEWAAIRSFLPNKPRGIPRVDDRHVLNDIFWVLRSGAPWRDLPETYGSRTTCYNHFVRWRQAGVWDRTMDALAAGQDAAVQMIDTSIGPACSATPR